MYEELVQSLRCHQSKEGKPCLSCSCKQQFFAIFGMTQRRPTRWKTS